MQEKHIQDHPQKASLSRRSFVTGLATSVAAPAAIAADRHLDEPDMLAIDRLEILCEEVGEILCEYDDGRFLVEIYPSTFTNGICFKPIRRHLTLDQQLDECVSRLKSILHQMHPDCQYTNHYRAISEDGRSTMITIAARAWSDEVLA